MGPMSPNSQLTTQTTRTCTQLKLKKKGFFKEKRKRKSKLPTFHISYDNWSTTSELVITTTPLWFSQLLSCNIMAIMRGRSRLTSGAPPPSPIPTAKGSRSASNENFTQFLDKCLQIPDLAWPPQLHPHFSGTRYPVPVDVDLRSLSSDAIARLLVSARESGAFRIANHGISAEELGSVVREAESVFGNDGNLSRRFVERTGNREEIKWVRESGQKVVEDEKYRVFW